MQKESTQVWKQYSGQVAIPTLILSGLIFGAYGLVIYLVAQGTLSFWVGGILNAIIAYVAFTPLHEATHGNIRGTNKALNWLETGIGWICAFMLSAPYSTFKVLHLRHHSHTNHPEDDPDFWVASRNPFYILAKCFWILPNYYFHFFAKPSKASKDVLLQTIVGAILVISTFVYTGMTFGWAYPLYLWILPAVFATAVLAFLFDWLPHHPHAVQSRYLDTRIILFPGLSVFMVSQNFHLIHHLYPKIPFYNYGKGFKDLRPVLEEKGSPIVEFGKAKETQD